MPTEHHRWVTIFCMHISNVFTSVFVALIILAGCATSDYGRITNKISAYEGQAATERDKLKTANPQSKLAIYQSLMKIYNNQLLIARRINPETNPSYKKGTVTLEQSKTQNAEQVANLENSLEQTIKARDELLRQLQMSATPAAVSTPATPTAPAKE